MGDKVSLAQIDTAIQRILIGGQAVKIGSRTITRADLAALLKMRKELAADEADEKTSGLLGDTYVAFFAGR